MKANELETQWNEVKASVRQKYNKLTDDDLRTIAGKKDQFVAKLQERYGMSHEEAQKDFDTFVQALHVTAEKTQTQATGGGTRY